MTIYRDFNAIKGEYASCIGFFDGVHKGHQFLLRHLKEEAQQRGLQSAIVTFINHPRLVVQPTCGLQLIDTLETRLEKLERMGLDVCFLLDFTEEVRCLTAEQFICDFLSKRLHIKRLLIGYDHRFGRDRAEGFADYVRYGAKSGVEVVQEPVFEDGTGLHYSSSEVRRALAAGDTEKARLLLGWDYSERALI